jgi:hypothetical protein
MPGLRQIAAVVSLAAALVTLGACSDGGGEAGAGGLQSSCVIDELGLERTLADGQECSNFGYSDCSGFGSECINSCAFDICQEAPCTNDEGCAATFGPAFECQDYVVSSKSYGRWCNESDCPRGTLGCPCRSDGSCANDPYGSGPMSCTDSSCESSCPVACRVGTSVCCGGALCSGDCIGTPCC